MTEITISNRLGVAAPYRYFHKGWVCHIISELVMYVKEMYVKEPLALPWFAKYAFFHLKFAWYFHLTCLQVIVIEQVACDWAI